MNIADKVKEITEIYHKSMMSMSVIAEQALRVAFEDLLKVLSEPTTAIHETKDQEQVIRCIECGKQFRTIIRDVIHCADCADTLDTYKGKEQVSEQTARDIYVSLLCNGMTIIKYSAQDYIDVIRQSLEGVESKQEIINRIKEALDEPDTPPATENEDLQK